MGWLKDYLNSRVDGKFQWYDLLHPLTSGINAITGNDRTEWVDDLYDVMKRGKEINEGKTNLAANGNSSGLPKQGENLGNALDAHKAEMEELKEANGGSVGGAIIDKITNEGKPGQTQLDKDANEKLNEITDKVENGVEYITGNQVEINGNQNPEGTGAGTSSEGESGPIIDGTDTNTGTQTIAPMDWVAKIEEWRENDRAREDQIRAETQQREDTAWQRSIEDLRKSGANINLIGAQPAQSGGGITSATGVDTSALTTSMDIELEEMLNLIDKNFEGSENEKDRLVKILGSIISLIAITKFRT